MGQAVGLNAVIVTYDCREHLRRCLQSLRDFPPSRPMQVQVVDNASTDGTVEMVQRNFPEVVLHSCPANLGFAAGSNIGIRSAREPYVLALNPDTRMQAGVLDTMLELMDTHPDVGVSGCRLELENGTLDHAARRSFPTPLSALGHFTGVGRHDWASRRLSDYRAPYVSRGPVDAVNGAFMLMRRSALDEVGLFDEGYWMYMEDLDLCYRFAKAGWLTWYEPSVTVIHVKHGCTGRFRTPRLEYAFHYGMLRFYRKHYAHERNAALNALVYAGISSKFLVSSLRSQPRRLLAAHRDSRRADGYERNLRRIR